MEHGLYYIHNGLNECDLNNEQKAKIMADSALQLFENGEFEKALRCCTESWRFHETSDILVSRSRMHLEMKNPLGAFMDACQALELNGFSFDARIQKALSLQATDRFVEARRDFEICRRIRPRDQTVINALSALNAQENAYNSQHPENSRQSSNLHDGDYELLVFSDSQPLRVLLHSNGELHNFEELPDNLRQYYRKIFCVTFMFVEEPKNLVKYAESLHPIVFTGKLLFEGVNFGSAENVKRLFDELILPESLEIDVFKGVTGKQFSTALRQYKAFRVITHLTFLIPNAGFKLDAVAILSFLHHYSPRKEKIFYLHVSFLDVELEELVELCINKFSSDIERSPYMLRIVCPTGTKMPKDQKTFNENTEEVLMTDGGGHCSSDTFANRPHATVVDAIKLDVIRRRTYLSMVY